MAVTTKEIKGLGVPGDLWYTVREVTFDSSYAEGGEPLSLTELGFGPEAQFVYADCATVAVGGTVNVVSAEYDGTKLHLYDETPAEVASGSNVGSVKVVVTTYCKAP